jgi:hypothetical protein
MASSIGAYQRGSIAGCHIVDKVRRLIDFDGWGEVPWSIVNYAVWYRHFIGEVTESHRCRTAMSLRFLDHLGAM